MQAEQSSDKAEGQTREIKGVIDRFEGKFAIIAFDDGQSLKWPIKNLPEDSEEGMAVRLKLSTSRTETEEREKIAKTLLNEILKTNED